MAFEFLQTESKEVAVSDDHNTQVRLYDESYSLVENALLKLVYSVFRHHPQDEEEKTNRGEGSVHYRGRAAFQNSSRALVLMASTR